jgi:protein tyrosine/serine phosphatase
MKLSIRNLILSLIIVPFLAGAIYALHVKEQGNFHQITEGQAYRSAQMDGEELKYLISRYQIKSILNLRGSFPEEDWYVAEKRISSEYAVKHYDIALSAYHEPTREEARILTEIIESAPRPILIHCQAGADRTGLVAAMWKALVDGKSMSEAEKELSVWYGHMPFGKVSAMDNFFKKWFSEMSGLTGNRFKKAGYR